ncbi:hypothetical protein [Tunicatimonas pelagia]|nr:hypothetical protein [Tunicatimonas pelagia]WKN43960.1 hypothetical protein P0M28_03110 [Tunicatimonas pelagia]
MDKSEKQQKEYGERMIASVNALTDIVQAWMEKTKKIDDFEERIRTPEQ